MTLSSESSNVSKSSSISPVFVKSSDKQYAFKLCNSVDVKKFFNRFHIILQSSSLNSFGVGVGLGDGDGAGGDGDGGFCVFCCI